MTSELLRTTIRLTPELYDAYQKAKKKGFELSVFVRNQLEKYFAENPEFLKDRFESLDDSISELSKYSKSLKQKYENAIELQKRQKERINDSMPEVMDYRTAITKKKGGK